MTSPKLTAKAKYQNGRQGQFVLFSKDMYGYQDQDGKWWGGEYMGDINLPPNHYEKCQVNENAGGEILYLNIMNKSDI